MANSNLKFPDYTISHGQTIREAMEIITLNHHGALVVVDDMSHVVGVVSDGDIRRAMVRGVIMEAPVIKAINHNFISLTEPITEAERSRLLNQYPQINVIPVLSRDNTLADLIVRGGHHREN